MLAGLFYILFCWALGNGVSLLIAFFSINHDIYQVVVNGEEGEYAEYEVEAYSYAEATAMAENLAADSMINISYIEVYLFQ